MGDKTGEQCYMIYNDQKHHDWFQQFMAGYGRHKRRATGNKNTAFMGQVAPPSSASEAAPRSRGVLVLPHTLVLFWPSDLQHSEITAGIATA